MSDVVVTLPKTFGLKRWIEEGDAAGEPRSEFVSNGGFYHWRVGKNAPKIEPGERVYVVYDGALIGYSPLARLRWDIHGNCYLIRLADAEAVTIDEYIQGFRNYRYRWWDRDKERPFPTWKEEYAKYLEGREVYVIPDNDESGEAHAKDVLESLQGRGKLLRLPHLPPKGDASDWFDRGNKAGDLLELASDSHNALSAEDSTNGHNKAILSTFTLKELLDKKFEPVKWIVPDVLPEGTMLLAGKPKMGKSWLALSLCIAVATEGEVRTVMKGSFDIHIQPGVERFDTVKVIRPGGTRRGLVARMERLANLKDAAKGRGPSARVAAMVLAQIRGERVRPL